MLKPHIGDTVIYRNKYGETDLPAVVVVTQDTYVEVSPKPEHATNPPIAAPSSALHVHLHVLTPGSTYPELDVAPWEPVGKDVFRLESGDTTMVPARSWRWPEKHQVEHLAIEG